MIRKLHIQNFKAWADTGEIKMAPLTIFCGNNSSGKSSIAQFLLMLKQTVESYDRKRVLHLGDDASWVDLGTVKNIIHKHDIKRNLSFGFEVDTEKIKIEDAVKKAIIGEFTRLSFDADVSIDEKGERSVLESLKYRLLNSKEVAFALNNKSGK